MIDLKSLQKKFPITEKKVTVESWGGEVKIKRLNLEETSNYIQVKSVDGSIAGMIEAVSSCLVEPEMSTKDINELSEDAFKGIDEIFKALNEFSESKK